MEILENTALSLGKKIRLKEIGVREAEIGRASCRERV